VRAGYIVARHEHRAHVGVALEPHVRPGKVFGMSWYIVARHEHVERGSRWPSCAGRVDARHEHRARAGAILEHGARAD
jgi:hypothetical protein